MSNDFLQSLRQTYFLESQELLSEIEASLLELDKSGPDPKGIECVFRCLHTLKGNSRSVGFDEYGGFVHKMESLLTKMQTGELSCNETRIDFLLKCNDALTQGLQGLLEDPDGTLNFGHLEEGLAALMQDSDESADAAMAAEVTEESDQATYDFSQGYGIFGDTQDEVAPPPKMVEKAPDSAPDVMAADPAAPPRPASERDEYARVPLSKTTELIDFSREQAGIIAQLEHLILNERPNKEEISHALVQLGDLTYQIQRASISFRMVSFKDIDTKLQRVLRDAAKSTGKKAVLVFSGATNEIEKGIVAPLVHMVRNAVDHGIELPEERIKAGKNEVGEVRIHSYKKGGFVFVEVSDDGKGLDAEKILARARTLGFVKAGTEPPPSELFKFVFRSGFSTKEVVTDLSGRGVGMDVVKSELDRMNCKISIESSPGEGTRFVIRMPLPIATFNGIIVRVKEQQYILPNSEIDEVRVVNREHITSLNDGGQIVKVNDEVITLLKLMNLSGDQPRKTPTLGVAPDLDDMKRGPHDDRICLLQITHNNKKYGIMVDEILSSQKVTYKKLGSELENIPGIAGGAVLGDGNVCLILNGSDLITTYQEQAC